ncbi:MAG: hypothetical protein KC561_00860 [Myxococcales bacterium]|nr:hypothetical protein [Myxococcales bacterium]
MDLRRQWFCALAALCTLSLLANPGLADEEELRGQVFDALTHHPLEGSVIRVGEQIGVADEDGLFALPYDPTDGLWVEVHALYPDGSVESLRQAIEHLASPQDIRVAVNSTALLDQYPIDPDGSGLPVDVPRASTPAQAIDLLEIWAMEHGGPSLDDLNRAYDLPEMLPGTIRVGRRFASSCGDAAVQRIDEVDLDTYAAGVVSAEIGVFRSLDDQSEGFKTFAIAARSYALWFWARDPDATYHLDDTACNQRYDGEITHEIILNAVAATSGQILVNGGTTATIDKYEYAASCGRHTTEPELAQSRDDEIPDNTTEVACVGSWCGHNNCAAHEVNPDFPDEGRCLVRGICQWGTAERSLMGQTYEEILEHYQPFLDVRDFDLPQPTRVLGYVRAESVTSGAGIEGAVVQGDGFEATTNSSGYFEVELSEPTPGIGTLTISADGYETYSGTLNLIAEVDNWKTVALQPIHQSGDASDVSTDPDMGVVETDTNEGGEPDLAEDTAVAQQDASRNPSGPAAGESPGTTRFALVGDDTFTDEGCSSVRGGTSNLLGLLLGALGLATLRRRKK